MTNPHPAWTRTLDWWNRDWSGRAFDGRNLRDELLATSPETVVDRNTHENYTVWGVALHVHKYKELLLATLQGRDPSWPEGDADFPEAPASVDAERWASLVAAMDATHNALVAHARTLDETFLAGTFAPWDISWGDAFQWATGHDGYHTAQIRNMRR